MHRERAHLKVPDWSLVRNELLTKKLPVFLSRWNEISGGCEKIVPVSESFWSNLKFLRMIDLTAWLWGWNVRVNGMRSVFSFSAVCSADCRSICWAWWWPAWTTMAQLHFLHINPHTTHNSSDRSDEGLILNNVLFFSRENLNIYIRARGLKPNRQINCWPWICCNTKRGGRSKNFLLWHYIKIAN